MATTHFAHAYEKGIDSQPRKTSVVASLVRDPRKHPTPRR